MDMVDMDMVDMNIVDMDMVDMVDIGKYAQICIFTNLGP